MISAHPLPRSPRLPLWLAAAAGSPRPCYGIGCPHHRSCARYHAVETSDMAPVDSCALPDGSRPGYAPVQQDDRVPVPGVVDGEGSEVD